MWLWITLIVDGSVLLPLRFCAASIFLSKKAVSNAIPDVSHVIGNNFAPGHLTTAVLEEEKKDV